MERVGLKQEFHGEPDPNQEGINAENEGFDQVALNIVGGIVEFIVPSQVPDDQVAQNTFIERFVRCQMQLENGAELMVWINAGSHGVDFRMSPPRNAKKRKTSSGNGSEKRTLPS